MVVPEERSSNCIRIFSLPSINIHSLPSQLTLFLKHSRKLVKSRWQEWAHSSHSSCLSLLLPAQTPDNGDSALWSPTSREAWFAHYYLIHYLTRKHLYTLQSQKYNTFPLNPALFMDMFTAFLQNHLTWIHTFPIYLIRKKWSHVYVKRILLGKWWRCGKHSCISQTIFCHRSHCTQTFLKIEM